MRISVTLLQECSVIKRAGIVLCTLVQLPPITLDASSSQVLERTQILKDVTQQKVYYRSISHLCQIQMILQNKGRRKPGFQIVFLSLKEKARKEIFVEYLLYARHLLDTFDATWHLILT